MKLRESCSGKMANRSARSRDRTSVLSGLCNLKETVNMTVLERIKEYDEDEMIEFLYRFSRDVLHHFSEFVMPNKENIRNLLEKEIPGTSD